MTVTPDLELVPYQDTELALFGIPVRINPKCARNVWACTKQASGTDGNYYTLFSASDPELERMVMGIDPIRLEMSAELYSRLA